MKIKDLNKDELNSGKGLPKGDTIVDFDTLDVEPIEIEYDGVKKQRFVLSLSEKIQYYVPKSLIADLKDIQLANHKKARITRTGELLDTKYTVIGL